MRLDPNEFNKVRTYTFRMVCDKCKGIIKGDHEETCYTTDFEEKIICKFCYGAALNGDKWE